MHIWKWVKRLTVFYALDFTAVRLAFKGGEFQTAPLPLRATVW